MSNNPLVTVIVPTFNRSKFILNTIKSVIDQTYQNIEIIIVDDCSDDDTRDVLDKISNNSIKKIFLEKNMGAPYARNVGITYSSGEYISFLDDDDIWLPNKIEKQLEIIKNDERIALVYSGFFYRVDEEFTKNKPVFLRGNIYERLISSNFIGSSSVPLIRKSCLEECGGFDESFKSCQDWDLWLRLAEKYNVDYVSDFLTIRVIHGEQISSDCHKKIHGRTNLIEKHLKKFIFHPKQLSRQYQRLATLYSITNNLEISRDLYIKSLKLQLADWKTLTGLVITYLPPGIRNSILQRFALVHYGEITFYH